MTTHRKPRGGRAPSTAIEGARVRENLPYPLVCYPRSGGLFIAFAPDISSPPALCACARPAIEHAVRLRMEEKVRRGQSLAPQDSLDVFLLPEIVIEQTTGSRDPLSAIRFKRGLCHRCNLAAPTLRYCHEPEGSRFFEHYGWYVGQAYLRYGICPGTLAYLPEVCPEELRPYVLAVEQATGALEEVGGLLDGGEASTGPVPESREEMMRAAQRRFLTRMYRRACRSLDKRIENLVRAEFGFKPVGEGWVGETMLYQIVRHLYPMQQVLRRHRPDWLGGLELDVYLPDLGLAFEYQGQQHFYPVRVWGGEEALRATQERDARKAAICATRGVTLITVDYTEPLTETYVRGVVAERGQRGKMA